jgi:hypothetical protein
VIYTILPSPHPCRECIRIRIRIRITQRYVGRVRAAERDDDDGLADRRVSASVEFFLALNIQRACVWARRARLARGLIRGTTHLNSPPYFIVACERTRVRARRARARDDGGACRA